MARVYFRQYYTNIVEKFLSTTVRGKTRDKSVTREWYNFTTKWIDTLSDEDKEFIRFVFDEKYYNTYAGVSCYPGEDFLLKYRRLYNLERKYAIAAGLLADEKDAVTGRRGRADGTD